MGAGMRAVQCEDVERCSIFTLDQEEKELTSNCIRIRDN